MSELENKARKIDQAIVEGSRSSELENKARKIAQAIVEGSRSKASPADIRKWSDEIFAAYQKNPDSPEVMECQRILSGPVERHIKPLMPFLEVFCGMKRR